LPPIQQKAQINPGLSISLDEKRGSRHSQDWYREQLSGLPGLFMEFPRSLSGDGYVTFETDSKRAEAYLSKNEYWLTR